MVDLFDTSNYVEDHPFFSNQKGNQKPYIEEQATQWSKETNIKAKPYDTSNKSRYVLKN